GVRPNARENGQIGHSTTVRARGAGISTSRLSCKRAGKTRTLMPVWDSSGESRLNGLGSHEPRRTRGLPICQLSHRMSLMVLGPPVIELYRQLKLQGALDGITEVMELGSQDFWCPQKNLVTALFQAFGKAVEDPALLNTSNASQKPARVLYEALGIRYGCVDVDGRV